jgi:D-serine deaminase-like pyridoxal phosphate-dependent protein
VADGDLAPQVNGVMVRPLRIPEITISEHHKGFPPTTIGSPAGELSGRLTVHDFLTPLLVLKSSAFEHNLATMQRFCAEHGLSLSPHVKTTMSPEIVAAQIEHGAWALTLATPSQVIAFRALGAERIVLANELVDPQAIDWISAEMDRDPAFTCYCYVDSLDGIDLLEKELGRRRRARRFPVIVELGVAGGRAGVRDRAQARRIAERVAGSAELELTGIGGFEGIITGELDGRLLADVRGYLRQLRETADEILRLHKRQDSEFIVTVGGSAFIELVADELNSRWRAGRPIRIVLRSGCYVTHDSLAYERFRKLVTTEYPALPLRPSLELWARVLSCPEPGLAILDFGKRDTGIDSGFPVPLHRIRQGSTTVEGAPPGEVIALNDQHAHFRGDLEIGDRLGFGISHPCTTFDKWRLFPIVDDEYGVTGTAQTLF